MKRTAAILALLGALLACAGGARASDDVSLTPLRGTHFPDRAYALTLPSGVTPTARRVHVTEEGAAVNGLTVTPAATDVRRRLGEVLVIDASASMRGRPIAAAMAAARAFAARRASAQPLAVGAVNRHATTQLPFTAEPARIGAALRSAPRAGGGTHVYDAIDTALRMVRTAHLAGASIVVLSDGSDLGSGVTASRVLSDAHRLHARIYGVGLRSAHFRPDTLSGLARGTQGLYTEAGATRQLESIYRALGSRLANAYVLRYRSLVGPGRHVEVVARVDGVAGVGTAAYTSPLLGGSAAGQPAKAGWASPVAVVLISGLFALLVAVALGIGLRTRVVTVQDRVEPFVDGLGRAPGSDHEAEEELQQPRAAGRLAGRDWWRELCLLLDVGRVPLSPVRLVLLTAAATVLAIFLIAVITGHAALGALGLATPLVAREVIRARARKQRLLFADQLADNLQVVASALRAGHGIVGGLQNTVDDAPEPSRAELRRVLAEEALGTPLEDALEIAVHRMANEDLQQVALVASVQRQTGGNAAEVLDRVVDSIRERMALRRLVHTLTAQGRLSGAIVSALPIVLIGAVSVLSPGFTRPLYETTGGNVVLVLAGALVLAGWLCIRRIVNFKV